MKIHFLRPTSHEVSIWGITFLLIPFFALTLATASFMLGGGIELWIFPTATLLALACGHLALASKKLRSLAIARFYIYCIALLLFALLSSAILYDNSFDGATYHQGAVIDMINGANPFHNPDEIEMLWGKHYAKALEIIAATITVCFNRIECGKAVNILIILSSVFITYAFLRRELSKLSTRHTVLLTAVLTLCPVVIRQAYIYYNDYTLYSLMLLLIISIIEIYRSSHSTSWLTLIITCILAATTKFTIGFYIYLTLAVAIVWIFFTRQRTLSYRLAIVGIILIVVGFGLYGFHPYITNTIGWGNPFYPLIGSNVDIMTQNTPEVYIHGNRLSNLFTSLFYNSQGTGVWIPFLSHSMSDYYISYDARIAGFGPLFGYILIGAFLLAAWVWSTQRKQRSTHNTTTYAIITTLLILACFIFEQSWWMRYIPFLWAVPVISIIYTLQCDTLTRGQRYLRNTLYSMIIATQLLCVATTFIAGISYTQRLGGLFHAVTPQSKVEIYSYGNIKSFNYKLQERNIPYTTLQEGEQPSDTTMQCVTFPAKAHIYVDTATYSRMQHPDLYDFILGQKPKE